MATIQDTLAGLYQGTLSHDGQNQGTCAGFVQGTTRTTLYYRLHGCETGKRRGRDGIEELFDAVDGVGLSVN